MRHFSPLILFSVVALSLASCSDAHCQPAAVPLLTADIVGAMVKAKDGKDTVHKPKQKRKYGWKQDKGGIRDRAFSTHPLYATISLPPSVDLSGGDPPVYDQGDLGSCTGNGVAYILAYAQHQQHGGDWMTFSRLFIYYNERFMEGSVNTDNGAQIRDGITSVRTQGAPPETLWPYDVDCFAAQPTPAAYSAAQNYLALTSYRVDNTDGVGLRKALAAGFPVVFGTVVYAQFETLSPGDATVQIPFGTPMGGHCLVVVGYDDKTQLYKVRNSWGVSWGEQGYCYFPYTYLHNPSWTGDCWVVSSVSAKTPPAPAPSAKSKSHVMGVWPSYIAW